MRYRRVAIVAGVLIPLLVGLVAAGTSPSPAQTTESDYSVVVGVQGVGTQGQVVAYGPDGSERWRYGDAVSYHDVTALYDGRVLAAYAVDATTKTSCKPYEPPCGRTGYRVIDPADGPSVVEEWSFPVRTVPNSEVHDVERIAPGQYVLADMDRERLLVVANGTVVWQWNASSYYDAPADPTRADWLHINDVDVLDAGRYLVSVRNADQLVVVERGQGVVEVINEAGNQSVMRGQHNPQWLAEDRMLVADSGNDRVVALQRDAGGRWRQAWGLSGANGVPFEWPRDVDRLPSGETLVTDSRNHRVLLLDDDLEVVASWHTPKLPYEADVVRHDEPVGGPTVESNERAAGTGLFRYPVIGHVTAAIHHTVGLPWYVTETHVLAGLGGLLLAFAGVGGEVAVLAERAQQRYVQHREAGTSGDVGE